MIVTRDDLYAQAMEMGIGDMFTGDIYGPEPAIRSIHMVGPEPPPGHRSHLSAAHIEFYSPNGFHHLSWPWEGYKRVPQEENRLPTVIHPYGTAEKFWNQNKGIHGFIRPTAGGDS
eukprot:6495047-Heterocapsa_arctica.AAC.1